jgi:hypothetical protein
MAVKYTKWPKHIPNGHEVSIPIHIFHSQYLQKIFPNWDFWYATSGNPGCNPISTSSGAQQWAAGIEIKTERKKRRDGFFTSTE